MTDWGKARPRLIVPGTTDLNREALQAELAATLDRRDALRGTNRNERLLRSRIWRRSPRSTLRGIVGA